MSWNNGKRKKTYSLLSTRPIFGDDGTVSLWKYGFAELAVLLRTWPIHRKGLGAVTSSDSGTRQPGFRESRSQQMWMKLLWRLPTGISQSPQSRKKVVRVNWSLRQARFPPLAWWHTPCILKRKEMSSSVSTSKIIPILLKTKCMANYV